MISGTHREQERAITYVGWAGHGNIGDEALYHVNEKLFKQYRLAPTQREKYSKVSLFGGGTLLPLYACSIFPNKYNYAIGVGVHHPSFWGYFDSFTADMMRRHHFRFLGVRGNISKNLLKSLGVESYVTGDTCLLLEASTHKRKDEFIAINVSVPPDGMWGNPELLLREITEFCTCLKADGYQPVLIPFWKGDAIVARRVSEAADIDVFEEWTDIRKVLDFIASCNLLIGERLHSVVFSAATFTPFVCMEYQPKCLDFAESVGFEKYTIRTNQVNSLRLMRLFWDLLDNWRCMQSLLIRKVEEYRKKLREFAVQISEDIESLPKDKWAIPGTVFDTKSRILLGSEFLLYNKNKNLWNAWNILPLKKHANSLRDMILFGGLAPKAKLIRSQYLKGKHEKQKILIDNLPKVSVIILTYNRAPAEILKCLKSVSSMAYPYFEIILVDNSDKPSPVPIKFIDKHIVYVSGHGNVGPAAGRNIGIKHSNGKYLFFLDEDVQVQSSTLAELVKIIENDPSIGIIGPLIIPPRVSFYKDYLDQYPEKDPIDVHTVLGCSMLAKRDILSKTGLFDEIYFFGHEEWDLCYRFQKAGFRTVFTTKARFRHLDTEDDASKIFIPRRAYFWHRNLFIFAGRNFNDLKETLRFLFRNLIYSGGRSFPSLYSIMALKNRKNEALKSYFLGIKDGLALYLKLRLHKNHSLFDVSQD